MSKLQFDVFYGNKQNFYDRVQDQTHKSLRNIRLKGTSQAIKSSFLHLKAIISIKYP